MPSEVKYNYKNKSHIICGKKWIATALKERW